MTSPALLKQLEPNLFTVPARDVPEGLGGRSRLCLVIGELDGGF